MRGFSGFILSVLLPGLMASFVGLGITAGLYKAWRQRRQPGNISSKRLFTLIGVSIWAVLVLSMTYTHLRIHYDLWVLEPADVQEITVADRHFSDQASIERIVEALKSSEWYSVNHGGWGDETPIVIRLVSGSEWQMVAGYHFAQHGAVLRRSSEPKGAGWQLGEVFSTALPNTLEKLGVPLSKCDTAHGRPCPPTP